MNIQDYIEEMIDIQTTLLDFIDSNDEIKEKYQNLIDILDDIKIHENKYQLKLLLYLLLKISNNHHREENFFNKIEQILTHFKENIKNFYSNKEIFNIFKSNKRILLFLIEEKILIFDEYITKKITEPKYEELNYPEYFSPEIQPFIKYVQNKELLHKLENIKANPLENFDENRKIGENENYVSNLIRNDLIKEFVIYVNKNAYRLNSNIKQSIYETNSFLNKKGNITLIEYAVFFGSIQIFNYLRMNDVELKPSLMIFAIHGQNPEIIHILEENLITQNDVNYEELFKESIQCHHIDIANYIQDNFLQQKNQANLSDFLNNYLKNYNFSLMKNSLINESSFYYLCKYDYYYLVVVILVEKDIDINKKIILTQLLFNVIVNNKKLIKFEFLFINNI